MAVDRTFSFLTLTVIIFCNGVKGSNTCPQHVMKIPHSVTAVHNYVCYLFVNSEVYWSNARNRCWDLGGEMLFIDNPETMSFIKQKLNSPELSWDREGVWLGASKISGRWRWTNGKMMNYTNWAPGQPSKVLGILSVEDCSQMRQDDGWKWHDIPCGALKFHYNYVCQFSLNKPGDVAGRVSSSAADQSNDNGNSSILTIIIGISTGLLLIMGMVFLGLCLHQRQKKQKASEVPVHFSNNTYHRGYNGSVPSDNQAPPIPISRLPLSSDEGLYAASQKNDKSRKHFQNCSFSEKGRNCRPVPQPDCSSVYSSPGTDSELGACGGSDPEQELKLPLMTVSNKTNCDLVRSNGMTGGTQHSCCCHNQGEYVDMNSLTQEKEKGRYAIEDDEKHTYSNVDHRDSGIDNLYEVLPEMS